MIISRKNYSVNREVRAYLRLRINTFLYKDQTGPSRQILTASWCSDYQYCKTFYSTVWTQVLRRLKSYSALFQRLEYWQPPTMVSARNRKTSKNFPGWYCIKCITKSLHLTSSRMFGFITSRIIVAIVRKTLSENRLHADRVYWKT